MLLNGQRISWWYFSHNRVHPEFRNIVIDLDFILVRKRVQNDLVTDFR